VELLRWRPGGPEKDESALGARGLEVFDSGDLVVSELVEVEGRDKSTEARGVSVSENARDFRRAGGKKPSALRGMRPISVGFVSLGSRTQESCIHGDSKSVFDWDGTGGMLVFVSLIDDPHPFGRLLVFGLEFSALSP
jgi:hypothetical protein